MSDSLPVARRERFLQLAFVVLAVASLFPWVSASFALFAGVVLGISFGNPWPEQTRKLVHRLLTLSIIGLGAGMNLEVVGHVGAHGIVYTALGISLTLLIGHALGRAFGCESGISTLVSVGTAICGGSAIAAVAPVIKAKHHEISVALATVFLLNAAALLLFPWIGHLLSLNQSQFGLWCALAIHDTSSVVGAAMQYGAKALEIGTTVKLARALWIVPVTLGFAWNFHRKGGGEEVVAKMKKPWFILGFLAAAALVTWIPALQLLGHSVENLARRTLVLTLFLIGSGLSRKTLAVVGVRPLLQGVLLWVIVATGTLAGIHWGWISL